MIVLFFYFCKVRTLLTYWLLLSMLFLVTPKEWHHNHADHQKDVSHETSMDESCFTCDFDLAQLNATMSIPQGLFIVNSPNTFYQFAQSYELESAIDLKGRAPPVIA